MKRLFSHQSKEKTKIFEKKTSMLREIGLQILKCWRFYFLKKRLRGNRA